MKASIVSVGDELLIGQVVNTNAAWIGEFISRLGITPVRVAAVGDEVAAIAEEIRVSFLTSDAVIVTGGLGPTHDDVTRDAVATYLNTGLRFDDRWFRLIERRFRRRGLSLPERNRSQALVPEGVEILPNDKGTAPGFWRRWNSDGHDRLLIVLPGVPVEMESLMRERVAPRLEPLVHSRIKSVTLRTAGIGESHLQEVLASIVDALPQNIRLAYLPSLYGVRLRVTVTDDDGPADEEVLDHIVTSIREAAGDYVYGVEDESLAGAVGKMLVDQGLRLACAESCTGGSVCDLLTDLPGASAFVAGGVVAYCNSVKVDVLGVDPAVLERDGAVSEDVAKQMAAGVLARTDADISVSSTGILGPTGGTADKPVGTVWIACEGDFGCETRLLRLGRDRLKNKQRASAAVLNLLRLLLLRRERSLKEA